MKKYFEGPGGVYYEPTNNTLYYIMHEPFVCLINKSLRSSRKIPMYRVWNGSVLRNRVVAITGGELFHYIGEL